MADDEALHCRIDDFTRPWQPAETVLLVHGLAESGEAFRGWVPHLARDFRVARLDLRGFGQSPRVPPEFPWSVDGVVRDLDAALDRLGTERAHVVGAKIGGTFALHFAAARPERVESLVLAGAPVSLTHMAEQTRTWRGQIAREGVPAWARSTMRARMGSEMGDAELEWWIDLMGRTPAETMEGFLEMVPTVDARGCLEKIRCPALVIASEAGALEPVSLVREWAGKLRHGRLETLPSNSYHIAAAAPDETAQIARRFLLEVASGPTGSLSRAAAPAG